MCKRVFFCDLNSDFFLFVSEWHRTWLMSGRPKRPKEATTTRPLTPALWNGPLPKEPNGLTCSILHLIAVKSFYDSINVFCNGFSCCHFCLFLCALCNSGISHICFIQCYLFFEVSELFSGQSIFFAPAYILKCRSILIFLKSKKIVSMNRM